MTNTSRKTMDTMYIHIAFHVPNESSANKQMTGMDNTMEDVFGKYAFMEESHYIHKVDAIEFIYRIQCPVLKSEETMGAFFKDLRKVFNAHSNLNPHFTQYSNDSHQQTQGAK